MKGLYYLKIELRREGVYYLYLLSSFHLELLYNQNMFKDYRELEGLFIDVLEGCKKERRLVDIAFAMEIDRLPFDKRNKIP